MTDSLARLKEREKQLVERLVQLTAPELRARTREILLDSQYFLCSSTDPQMQSLVQELIAVQNELGWAR